NQLESFDANQLTLSTTEGGEAIGSGLPLTEIPSQPGYSINDCDNPLFIRVVNHFYTHPSTPTVWRATGLITGAKQPGCRHWMYRAAQPYAGFYEKRKGIKLDPFSYRDNGTLAITVLFDQRRNAVQFRAAVYEKFSTLSPDSELAVSLSVNYDSKAVLDGTILVAHFIQVDESLSVTPKAMSGVTELDTTSTVFRYQRLGDERFFCSLYKANRAHLIEKSLCEKGKRFAKFHDNENNFLALTRQVHSWFEARSNGSEKIPFFKLLIKHVSANQDPANDFRYCVLLTVEAYNAEIARWLFPRLKEGSSVVNDTHAETFVYVLDPEEFRVCISWKNDQIDSLWNFTPQLNE
ncbi:hypothetical protein HK103_000384, partial [Boothiomyces macroporosus]